MVEEYIPQPGDIVMLSFDPRAGHEQKGRRPALVISGALYHVKTNLTIVCPITNTNRNFPLHVNLGSDLKTRGVIMCEQVRSVDYRQREACLVEKSSALILKQVRELVAMCIED